MYLFICEFFNGSDKFTHFFKYYFDNNRPIYSLVIMH